MRKVYHSIIYTILFALIACGFIACNRETKFPLEIHLSQLEKVGFFEVGKEIKIPKDKLFQKPKRYWGLPLKKVLESKLNLYKLEASKIRLTFKCNDRYVVSMPLDKALSKSAFIAVKDLEAPLGKDWIDLDNHGKIQTPAPYYMVWVDAPLDDNNFVWPYQLNTILVEEITNQ